MEKLLKAPVNLLGAVSTTIGSLASSNAGLVLISGISISAGLAYGFKSKVLMIGQDEQLFLDTGTDQQVINGPKVKILPLIYKSAQLRKAISLTKLQYCIVQNTLDGSSQVHVGPKLLYLDPYCQVKDNRLHEVFSLMKNEFIRFIDQATGNVRVVRGDQTSERIVPSPTEQVLASEGVRKALDLKLNEYVVIENTQTGQLRTERGEKLVFLDAFEQFVEDPKTRQNKRIAVNLKPNQYVVIEDSQTGQVRVEKGEQLLFLSPFENYSAVKTAIPLNLNEYIKVENRQDGTLRCVYGEQLFFPGPFDVYPKGIENSIDLKSDEFIKIENKKTGTVRVEKGEQQLFLQPYEVSAEGKQKAINLTCFEYTKIIDKQTGKIRTEKGEKLVFLNPFDEIDGHRKCNAIEVDEETAVLIRNKRTGEQKLVQEKQLFFPADDEEIIESRKLEKLADYEACIVRGKDGQDKFYYGKNEGQRSFFLPPYSEMVTLNWSRGRRREKRDLYIKKIDLRPMFMSFEFNCRTSDNVELILEGTLFWEIVDPETMVKFTGDTSGDVCAHARSQFIQAISKVKLEDFMTDFNQIAERAHKPDDIFYKERGCKIHTLEVTGYSCAEKSTARVLEQIIQETTNRMNRLQQQESASEVKLTQIKGQIEEEKARSELLSIQTDNSNAKAAMEGLGEAEKVKKFLKELETDVPDLETRIKLWGTLRKTDALEKVTSGDAKLFFTPSDVELKIDA